MIEKMSLEQFKQIKNQLAQIVKEFQDNYEAHGHDENYDYDKEEQRVVNQYLKIQNRLSQYDLSDIPYSEWSDMAILSDESHEADFSKTNANIDFKLVKYAGTNANFRGCNIRNLNSISSSYSPEQFDENTIKDNPNEFLSFSFNANFKSNYYTRNLKLIDFIGLTDNELEELKKKNIISHFNDYIWLEYNDDEDYNFSISYQSYLVDFIISKYGQEEFLSLIKKHSDVLLHIAELEDIRTFNQFLKEGKDLESAFSKAVKQYFSNYGMPDQFKVVSEGQTIYNVPKWLSSMNFQFVEKLNTANDLLQYTDSVLVIDNSQRLVLDTLNIENIRRFEQETGFFTHKGYEWSRDLEMFNTFSDYFRMHSPSQLEKQGIDFKNGNISYEEFLTQFANCLDHMRKNGVFTDFPSYDWIQGEFRESHPEIFIDLNAPVELKIAFYRNRLNPEFLYHHKEYVKYLVNKNLSNTIRADMKLAIPGLIDEQGRMMPSFANFVDEYVSRYGNEKFLQLCAKYGVVLSNITITSLHDEIENEQAIEQSLRNAIYNKIIKGKADYSYLASVPELVTEHPEIFVNFDNLTSISQEERQRLTKAFYTRTLSFDDIKKYPELANALKDKNLSIAFGDKDGNHHEGRIFLDTGYGRTSEKKYSDLELLQVFGNEKFLQLCAKYGRYMDGIAQHLNKDITIRNGKYIDFGLQSMDFENGLSIEEISKRIENIIARESKLGNLAYNPEDAPDFLKENYPELFLGADVPDELKRYFYNYANNYPMTFEVLQRNKDWLPFLKDKSLTTSLLRNNYLKKELIQYFELFGEEKGIKLGINRAETVKEMMRSHQVELMKSWYDKTGGKFIPDFVVMQNFRLEEADKFLASGSNWSNLMRIQSFARTPESRDALLKLAYSFGAFDQDQRGFKKLQDLLTSLPKRLDADKGYIIDQIDHQIDQYSQRGVFYHNKSIIDINGNRRIEAPNMTPEEKEEAYNKMIEYAKKNNFIDLIDTATLVNLLETLKKEKVDIDFSKPIFAQLYKKNEDGSYTLTINAQSCPKSSQAIRGILEKFRELPILTPDKAHHYLGGFKLEYDSDFREFFLSNFDIIIGDSKYLSQISAIQRRFEEIKTIYSNVNLTLDLAMSYINNNKYENVNTGNERVTQVAGIQNYSQQDFEILQQIYNYGKQRTFSSIPRISSDKSVNLPSGTYHYEILRLDDPRAMSIGFESDCCQRLGEPAEVCMEHSMVDKNGRVFIITNTAGEIVAQSWVWRNKDVLCFDNIEVPDQKMWDNGILRGQEDSGIRNQFTDDILAIYKMVAHELIEVDEKVYKELLDSNKITQEQYEGLRLGKITAGLGYSNIKGSLKTLPIDKTILSRPLPFEEPVKLSRGLYTSDSTTQYILEERDDRREFDGDTLPVHSDSYTEYNDSNFTEKSLLSLEKLEIVTKEDPRNLDTSVSDYADSEHLVTEIARNYGLNPETARIIMNPNFAIIYDVNGDRLRVGDLLFNTKVDNEQQQMDIESQVVMQMRLALEQIASDKEIDVSTLDEKQKEMYAKITGLTDEMDIERGVGHAR
jgi:hypothetical protein